MARIPATNQTEVGIIVAEGLTKHFMHHGETVRAVDGVSFTLSSPQLVVVTGPSGCGKSTLLYLLGAPLENVMLPMELSGRSRRDRAKRAQVLLAQVEIGSDRWSHRPGKLSAGQQRVAIARSLANDPPVILADEPTGNLDSHTSEHIVELLLRLTYEGRIVILVTHDKDIACQADTHLSLRDGRVSPAKADTE